LTIPDTGIGFDTQSGNSILTINSDPNHPNFQALEISPEGARIITSISLDFGVHDTIFDTDQALSRLVVLDPDAYIVRVMDLPAARNGSLFRSRKP
jgi:hypothetical protein